MVYVAFVLLLVFVIQLLSVWSHFHKDKGETEQAEPHWEVVPSLDAGEVIGYRVRWSQPDDDGAYLWVGHYLSGEELSLAWCNVAANSHCQRLIRDNRFPWEWDAYHPRRSKTT